MFNKYIWNTYLSANGKDIVNFFEKSLSVEFTNDYADFICNLHKDYCPSKVISKQLCERLDIETIADLYECMENNLFEDGQYTIESALDYIYKKSYLKKMITSKALLIIFQNG